MESNAGKRRPPHAGAVRVVAGFATLVGAVELAWRAAGDSTERLVSAARTGRVPDVPVDALVLELASLVFLVAVAVLAILLGLSATSILLGDRGGRLLALCGRVTPLVCRRLVVACCGVGLATPVLAGPPAMADEDGRRACHFSSGADPVQLGGLELPDLPARSVTTSNAVNPVNGDAGRTDGALVVVRAGDSLWRIAERLLPPSAGDGDVERQTFLLYALNRQAIGDDPDLIFPGTTLIAPEGTS